MPDVGSALLLAAGDWSDRPNRLNVPSSSSPSKKSCAYLSSDYYPALISPLFAADSGLVLMLVSIARMLNPHRLVSLYATGVYK
jgi:hypothetical protein